MPTSSDTQKKAKAKAARQRRKQTVFLKGVDPKQVDEKYGIAAHLILADGLEKNQGKPTTIQDAMCQLEERLARKAGVEVEAGPEVVGVTVRTVSSARPNASLCWWCRHPGEEGNLMIGIPVRESANIAEIHHMSFSRAEKFVTKGERLYSGSSVYITEGHYCSYECRLAWIRANCLSASKSEELLVRMRIEDRGINSEAIRPAKSWKLLRVFGGSLEQRDLFSRSGPTFIGMTPGFEIRPLSMVTGFQ